jgi:site-specific DNA recombinase
MHKRAAIYIRVSSDEQLDTEALDNQERACREWCERNDYTVVRLYRDEAISGGRADRVQFQQMLSDARRGQFDAIVVRDQARFTRSMGDWSLLESLRDLGVTLCSVKGALALDTDEGESLAKVTLFVDDNLRAYTSRVTRISKRARAIQTGRSNGRPPFGYAYGPAGVHVPGEHAPVVLELFQRFVTGNYTDLQLADWLNAQGHRATSPFPGSRKDGANVSRPFGKEAVRVILTNAFYCGYVAYRPTQKRKTERGDYRRGLRSETQHHEGKHEPIVGRDLFDQCQQVRAARGLRFVGRKPAVGRVLMLARMAHCAHCGGRLRGTRWGQGPDAEAAYRCTARERACDCGAQRRTVREAELLDDLADIIARLTLDADTRAAAERIIAGQSGGDIERKRNRLDAELGRLNRMYLAGNVEDAFYDTETRRIRGALAELAIPTGLVDIEAAIAQLDELTALWAEATPAERADILRGMFDAVAIDLDARQIVGVRPKKHNAAVVSAAFYKDGSDGIRTRGLRRDRATCWATTLHLHGR